MDTLINSMWAYQKEKGIKNQCMTNSQFVYDCLQYSGVSEARVSAALVLHQEGEAFKVINHLVVRVNDAIVDASYDVASLRGKKYCFTVAECLDTLKDFDLPPAFKKKTIELFVEFLDISKRMNAGEILVANRVFYTEQADFVAASQK